ncbi:hypothetical protein PVAP13_2KG554330 [Panicum virgatum]|uniref:Uncharacterized protein n=1 Tax=Panicum virgatum TaxID=38727 RepID=A0A8T0WB93_PANVG|nr:hypothetical protein PVAP13_2KG554330 [Panicum virgatum]
MLGSRVATIRDLLALAEPGWSPPSRSGGAPVPAEGSLFAAGHVPRRRPRPRRPVLQKRKRTGAPSSTAAGGVPSCNPETSVGLMAAVAEPASARLLRVAEPARAGASGIVAALAADLNRNSTSGDTGRLLQRRPAACPAPRQWVLARLQALPPTPGRRQDHLHIHGQGVLRAGVQVRVLPGGAVRAEAEARRRGTGEQEGMEEAS